MGRTLVASSGGVIADRLGWEPFFMVTTVATLPALILVVWIARRGTTESDQELSLRASTRS
jgi:PAT family beta-lactamase induction signal transducer AmpG